LLSHGLLVVTIVSWLGGILLSIWVAKETRAILGYQAVISSPRSMEAT
jgi:hypothetical protein